MTIAPILFQTLLDLHGVDVAALEERLVSGRSVRTRTWPAGSNARDRLESLPLDFPRFKGAVVKGELRIESMWLDQNVSFKALATVTRLTMPVPNVPETVLAGLAGRRLAQFAGHPAFDGETVIVARREQTGRNGDAELVLDLDMPRIRLVQRSAVVARRDAVHIGIDVETFLDATHQRLAGASRMPDEMAGDPRSWERTLDRRYRVAGLRIDPADGTLMLRFPYDPVRVTAIGRAGIGAWFDRETYSWRVPPSDRGLAGLSGFLRDHADIVVDPQGHLHLRRRD